MPGMPSFSAEYGHPISISDDGCARAGGPPDSIIDAACVELFQQSSEEDGQGSASQHLYYIVKHVIRFLGSCPIVHMSPYK